MGSLSPLTLPIVNFSRENLDSGATRSDIRRALEEFGCFEFEGVCDDYVSLDLHKAMFGLLENFFDLPLETKSQNTLNSPYPGYIGSSPRNPLYEGMGIPEATVLESAQRFTDLMRSEGKSSYGETIHSNAIKTSELTKMVAKLLLESYDVENYYESFAKSLSYSLRLMKYKAPMTEETKLAAACHTDKNFCSILQQNHVNGLEVESKDGEWISVTLSSPSSFIFIVGDGFHAWTNGRVHPPNHRVTMKGNEDRYSIGQFAFYTDLVQCPEELVDEEHPLLFKPFDQLELLDFYRKHVGPKDLSVLRAFCGV